jgi:hypothetical protein
MAWIFISYRREDSGASAGRLHDRLREHFGRDNVFMDLDAIEPGLDFTEVIERTVASCDVLIALIGRQWLTSTDPAGQRRLDDPEDFVRREIATALRRNIRVIPALIQDTPMPRVAKLPDDLQPLTRSNAVELSDTHFHRDVDQLIVVLDRVLEVTPSPSAPVGPPRVQSHTHGLGDFGGSRVSSSPAWLSSWHSMSSRSGSYRRSLLDQVQMSWNLPQVPQDSRTGSRLTFTMQV